MPVPRLIRTFGCAIVAVLSMVSLLGPVGCGYTAGQALYWTGLFKGPKIEPEHILEDRVLLILVDDPDERVHWPQTMTYLAESMRRELLDHEVVSHVLAADTVYRLRAAHADFNTRGCREIGRMAGADRVLWLEVRDFYARQEISDIDVAARLAVTVKLIDAGEEEDRTKVRVWPVHPNGRRVSADLTAGEVTRAKGVDRIAHLLADQVADKVAKLFYKHTADDFDRSSR
ncbi:MAG: hypothetical protein IID37_06930 [Planctomycetes bacterium]|nr:hypothetical protein [Planctomycetota bacterium]